MREVLPEWCRAVWAALESLRPVTLDDLQVITGIAAPDIAEYISMLMRGNYIEIHGIRWSAGGEAVPIFRLRQRTGPDAPYWDYERCELVDPNVDTPEQRPKRQRWQLPSMGARIIVAAEARTAYFGRAELFHDVCKGPEEAIAFSEAWSSLRHRGEIRQVDDSLCKVVPSVEVQRIRAYFMAHLGAEITAKAVGAQGSTIRRALDLLAAAGYSIHQETLKGRHPCTSYRVENPERQP